MDKLSRVLLIVEFDGHAYSGWQRQKNAYAVQQALEEAISKIEQHEVQCFGAGRTDKGVHAQAMPVHVDVSTERLLRSKRAYVHGVNQLLPLSIRVLACVQVEDDFHARFDCLERAYCYRIWCRNTSSSLDSWRHWWMPRELDVVQMELASQVFMGRQDFSSVRASGCQAASAVREIRELSLQKQGYVLEIHVRADAFLYHMVRNIVGSLVQVGLAQCSVDQLSEIMKKKDRSLSAATAPAHGLYFSDARYEKYLVSSILENTNNDA
ncbi:MAG: tRNA pseudouridine(38-40) synthase TruA [Mariprofundaceae bacterium]|nr:tRNA pseudouridine(38-40) synthase TruA [Mariprofundaceae bacterium]